MKYSSVVAVKHEGAAVALVDVYDHLFEKKRTVII